MSGRASASSRNWRASNPGGATLAAAPGPHRLRRTGPHRLRPRGHPRHPARRRGDRAAPDRGRQQPRAVDHARRARHPDERSVDGPGPPQRTPRGPRADPDTVANPGPGRGPRGRTHSDVDDVGACRPAAGERAPQPRVGQPHRTRGPTPFAQRDPAQVEPPHPRGEPARARLPAVGVELAGEHEPVGHHPGHLRVPLQRGEAQHEEVTEHHGLQDGTVDAAVAEHVPVQPDLADPLDLQRRDRAAVQLAVTAQQVQRVDLAVGGGLVVGAGVPDVHLGVDHRAGHAPDGVHLSRPAGPDRATVGCSSPARAAECPRRAARTRSSAPCSTASAPRPPTSWW